MARTHLNMQLEEDLKQSLQKEADAQSRSLSNLVTLILRAHVAAQKEIK